MYIQDRQTDDLQGHDLNSTPGRDHGDFLPIFRGQISWYKQTKGRLLVCTHARSSSSKGKTIAEFGAAAADDDDDIRAVISLEQYTVKPQSVDRKFGAAYRSPECDLRGGGGNSPVLKKILYSISKPNPTITCEISTSLHAILDLLEKGGVVQT